MGFIYKPVVFQQWVLTRLVSYLVYCHTAPPALLWNYYNLAVESECNVPRLVVLGYEKRQCPGLSFLQKPKKRWNDKLLGTYRFQNPYVFILHFYCQFEITSVVSGNLAGLLSQNMPNPSPLPLLSIPCWLDLTCVLELLVLALKRFQRNGKKKGIDT